MVSLVAVAEVRVGRVLKRSRIREQRTHDLVLPDLP